MPVFLFLFVGVVHADLKLFLETNLPLGGKKKAALLGAADGKIGAALQEELGVSVQTGGVVAEILRGLLKECESDSGLAVPPLMMYLDPLTSDVILKN